MNRHTVIGFLTRNAESLKTNPSSNLLRFTVAVNESYKDKQGNWQKKTDFINCQAWGKLAERLEGSLNKGMKVFVEGASKTHEYEKQGVRVYTTNLVAKTIEILEFKKTNEATDQDQSFEFNETNYFEQSSDIPF